MTEEEDGGGGNEEEFIHWHLGIFVIIKYSTKIMEFILMRKKLNISTFRRNRRYVYYIGSWIHFKLNCRMSPLQISVKGLVDGGDSMSPSKKPP